MKTLRLLVFLLALSTTFPARATAIAVLASLVSEGAPGKWKLEVDSSSSFLCRNERFSQDPFLSYSCTGFLVGPDLIATAGHCMVNTGESRHETDTYCQAFSWLFDFRFSSSGKLNLDEVPAENLYRCKEVIYAVKDEKAPFRDFALVRLERPVVGRTPAEAFVPDREKNCSRFNRCNEEGTRCEIPDGDTSVFPEFQRTGSDVQRIQPLREWIESL
jgi:hypothetical protein